MVCHVMSGTLFGEWTTWQTQIGISLPVVTLLSFFSFLTTARPTRPKKSAHP